VSAKIAGLGWVTPLGTGLDEVWARIVAGDIAEIKTAANPETGRAHPYAPAPMKMVDSLGRNPRTRRSSPISYFAVAAGLAALENAGFAITPQAAAKTALVFAISSGGVIYTRKLYEQIVKQGANAASPLLFPETVYNAPASHLAAHLGIDGATYTLVGDGSVGLAALNFGRQLLALGDLDRVVVVGSEEIDWVLCEAFRDWRLARAEAGSASGALLAEGAAAVVLAREGSIDVPAIHPGVPFFRRREAASAIDRAYSEVLAGESVDIVIGGANGTFVDRIERAAIAKHCPRAECIFPKRAFGEALGAGALMQVVAAALAMRHGGKASALVSSIGFNQQASAARLKLPVQ